MSDKIVRIGGACGFWGDSAVGAPQLVRRARVDYLMFENEGHDVLKLENRVTCYNAITEHFKKHL